MENQFHKQMRKSGFDYSERGQYFITICVNERKNLLGKIQDGKMVLNDAGKMVELWYQKLQEKYPEIKNVIYTIMPNHFHCIVYLNGKTETTVSDAFRWFKTMTTNEYIRHVKSDNWPHFNKHFWQLSFWDVIITSDKMFDEIYCYILNNPINWKGDKLFSVAE